MYLTWQLVCLTGAGEGFDTPKRASSTCKQSPKSSPVVICLLSSDSEDAEDEEDQETEDEKTDEDENKGKEIIV